MEIEPAQLQLEAQKLQTLYPTIPAHVILKKLHKYGGDVTAVETKLRLKTSKNKQLYKGSSDIAVPQEVINALCVQFPNAKRHMVVRLLERKSGNIEEVRKKLHQRTTPGKDQEENHLETSQVVVIFNEVVKVYPGIPQEIIQKHVTQLCRKLDRKKLKLDRQTSKKDRVENGKRSSSSSSSSQSSPSKEKSKKHHGKSKERREKSDRKDKATPQSPFEIPENLSRLVLDGNNMLYVNDILRNITIKKGMKAGSESFANYINQVSTKLKCDVLLVFDRAGVRGHYGNIKVEVARPQYDTADDWIAEYSGKLTLEEKQKVYFVTSDVGLQKRILDSGCSNIVKSGHFIRYCETLLAFADNRV